ncbi:HAD family hydrolase [Deinococcus taeanensis]|uniref:HAD family hydrolase n=1 Tax=Deinococcus taeanensis TaxID=2737050 RepID=UPI001CDC0BC8|nr:HAD family hydrolase [Deinococcus taeanensis]UBV41890.1 HAD family hydrolase [Deinococcus taeanensis]
MSPAAILFDLDGTLHDRAATVRAWLREHVRHFGLPDGYAERFLALEDHGYRPKADVIPQLVREFGLKHDPQVLLDTYAGHVEHAAPMPHALQVLRVLRERGVRTGVVTNGWENLQRASLRRCGLEALTDDVVISRAVGLSKPDPRLYTLALDRLGVPARRAWFVGDSPRNDVWGPQQVGLRAAWLPTTHALTTETPDVTLRDLRDVLTLPG